MNTIDFRRDFPSVCPYCGQPTVLAGTPAEHRAEITISEILIDLAEANGLNVGDATEVIWSKFICGSGHSFPEITSSVDLISPYQAI